LSASLTFVGHSTVLIEVDGTRLLTDPVLGSRVAILRRLEDVPEVPGLLEPDAVLISHAHLDHLHTSSLRRLSDRAEVIAPPGLRRFLARGGYREVTEVSPGERVGVGSAEVLAVPAAHDGRRYRFTRPLPAIGYVITGGGAGIYFAGDTDLFGGMDSLGQIDLALLPISGWGRTLGPGHLDPERAAQAAAAIKPRMAVPIHWGTLVGPRVSRERANAPPAKFAKRVSALAPEVEVRVLKPGETVTLGSAGA
jgi:L-ascorbate metabolism protein UlaG (beta-lactamase superfamily)